jgi:hypothetical protein
MSGHRGRPAINGSASVVAASRFSYAGVTLARARLVPTVLRTDELQCP